MADDGCWLGAYLGCGLNTYTYPPHMVQASSKHGGLVSTTNVSREGKKSQVETVDFFEPSPGSHIMSSLLHFVF